MDFHFNCTRCGRCCRNLKLPLTASEAMAWLAEGHALQLICEAMPALEEPAVKDPKAAHRHRRSFEALSGSLPTRVIVMLVANLAGQCPNLRTDMRCGIYDRRRWCAGSIPPRSVLWCSSSRRRNAVRPRHGPTISRSSNATANSSTRGYARIFNDGATRTGAAHTSCGGSARRCGSTRRPWRMKAFFCIRPTLRCSRRRSPPPCRIAMAERSHRHGASLRTVRKRSRPLSLEVHCALQRAKSGMLRFEYLEFQSTASGAVPR